MPRAICRVDLKQSLQSRDGFKLVLEFCVLTDT